MEKSFYIMIFKTRFGMQVCGIFESLKDTEEMVLSQPADRRKYYVVERFRANYFYPEYTSADHIEEIRSYVAEGYYEGETFFPFSSDYQVLADASGQPCGAK